MEPPNNTSECAVCHLPVAQDIGNHAACPFCQRIFARADGARRHAKSCRLRGNRTLPQEAKRGRRLHACDQCSRVKVSCDAKTPCSRCSSRRLTCTYERQCTDPSHRTRPRQDRSHGGPRGHALNLSALIDWTDPTVVSLSGVIAEQPEKEQEQAEQGEQAIKTKPVNNWPDDTIDPRLLFLGVMDLDSDQIMESTGNYMNIEQDMSFPSPLEIGVSRRKLGDRMTQLATDLHQFTANKPNLQRTFETASPHTFLTEDNCSNLITAYSRRRYYQSPIIHWPTFDPERAPLPLLLAVMLTGAAYTSLHGESLGSASATKAMQEVADKYIFFYMKKLTGSESSSFAPEEALELCQAAFLINWLHINFNDIDSRWKVMASRHPLLVGTLRRLGFNRIYHDVSVNRREFAYREGCIRLITWTFLIDSLLTVYCNHPPHMSLSEMLGPLPCSEEIWHADSVYIFEKEGLPLSMPCLKDLVVGLLSKEWTDAMKTAYEGLSARHLHTLIIALQPTIYNYHASLMSTGDADVVIIGALDRWGSLWDKALEGASDEQKRWLGVAGYSRELAWITRRIIEVGLTKEGRDSNYLQRTAAYDTASVHQFIKQFKARN